MIPGNQYADSTGKPIKLGDQLRFRGHIFTLAGFGQLEDGVAILIPQTPITWTTEVPTETSVDLY